MLFFKSFYHLIFSCLPKKKRHTFVCLPPYLLRYGNRFHFCLPQFANWGMEVSTGHFHLNGFDSHLFTKKRKGTHLCAFSFLEQGTGIEPASEAWEATIIADILTLRQFVLYQRCY